MKIPDDMTEKEVLEKIMLVIDRISPKYTFAGYEVEDIKQEAFIICLNAMDRYNKEIGPLENFLSINLSNRLKNFIRDNFCKKGDIEKKKVIAPSTLSFDCMDTKSSLSDNTSNKEIRQILDENIPTDLRIDYLKMMGGVSITKKRKVELIEVIKGILRENGINETW